MVNVCCGRSLPPFIVWKYHVEFRLTKISGFFFVQGLTRVVAFVSSLRPNVCFLVISLCGIILTSFQLYVTLFSLHWVIKYYFLFLSFSIVHPFHSSFTHMAFFICTFHHHASNDFLISWIYGNWYRPKLFLCLQ